MCLCRLAAAGLRVCVLEKGREWGAEDFGRTSSTSLPNLRLQTRGLLGSLGTPDGSLFDIRLEGDVIVCQGSGLGGGSLVNTAVAIRPTPQVFFQCKNILSKVKFIIKNLSSLERLDCYHFNG